MAYITSEQVKQMRNEIKSLFPKSFKFSITREHYSSVNVAIMQSPLTFSIENGESESVNHFYLENLQKGKHKTIFRIIKEVISKGNFDHSDLMSDYHHVGWYTNLRIGQWDKPYRQIKS